MGFSVQAVHLLLTETRNQPWVSRAKSGILSAMGYPDSEPLPLSISQGVPCSWFTLIQSSNYLCQVIAQKNVIKKKRSLDITTSLHHFTHPNVVSEPLLYCLLELWGKLAFSWFSACIRRGGWRRPLLRRCPLFGQLKETGSFRRRWKINQRKNRNNKRSMRSCVCLSL